MKAVVLFECKAAHSTARHTAVNNTPND